MFISSKALDKYSRNNREACRSLTNLSVLPLCGVVCKTNITVNILDDAILSKENHCRKAGNENTSIATLIVPFLPLRSPVQWLWRRENVVFVPVHDARIRNILRQRRRKKKTKKLCVRTKSNGTRHLLQPRWRTRRNNLGGHTYEGLLNQFRIMKLSRTWSVLTSLGVLEQICLFSSCSKSRGQFLSWLSEFLFTNLMSHYIVH